MDLILNWPFPADTGGKQYSFASLSVLNTAKSDCLPPASAGNGYSGIRSRATDGD